MPRPPKGDENRRNITLRLEPSFIDRIDDKAEQLGIPRTALIENFLFNALTSPETEASTKEELAQEDNSNSNEPDNPGPSISKDYQEGFDAGHGFGMEAGNAVGRQELMKELAEMDITGTSNPNGAGESHEHEFKPWLKVCLVGSCSGTNPDFVKGYSPETKVRCDNCTEELGELKDAIKLNKCPSCEEPLSGKVNPDPEDDSE